MANTEYNLENAAAQLRKGFLEFPVLLIVGAGEAYASDILNELKKVDLIVVEGTLYPLLSRLRRLGLVEYTWKESKSGPPRKYYMLTQKGRSTLSQLKTTWGALSGAIETLIRTYEKSN